MMETRDELIEMGNCANPACKKPWTMTQGEKAFFDEMIKRKAAQGDKFSIPTHCLECRNARKLVSDKGKKITPESIISRLEHMEREAEKGHYIMDDEELANDLRGVIRLVKSIFGPKTTEHQRRTNVETKESVGQPSQSGSVPAES